MPLLGGMLCEVAYIPIPYTPAPFKILFYSNQGGGGHGPVCPLACASVSGAARLCQRGAKSNQPSGGRVWEGFPPPPPHGREIFENLCMKTAAFSCTLNAIISGNLCSGIDQFPLFFFLFNFPFDFFSGKRFHFLFPFFFARRSTGGGGGGHGPLVPPLATPVFEGRPPN